MRLVEIYPSPLEKQPVLITTELSLQSWNCSIVQANLELLAVLSLSPKVGVKGMPTSILGWVLVAQSWADRLGPVRSPYSVFVCVFISESWGVCAAQLIERNLNHC